MNLALLNAIKKYLDVVENQEHETSLFTQDKIMQLKNMTKKLSHYLEKGDDYEFELELADIA